MSQNPERTSESFERDERYGQLLAKTLRSDPPAGPCLSADEIDALVAGLADVSFRERCLAHLATCESCLRSFGIASDLKREEKTRKLRQMRIGIPLAMAAVLVLAFATILARRPQNLQLALKQERPALQSAETVKEAARPPAERTAPVQEAPTVARRVDKSAIPPGFSQALSILASLQPESGGKKPRDRRSFGYATQESPELRRFLAGQELLSARIDLARGDRELAATLVKRASERMSSGEGGPPPPPDLARLATDLPAADPARSALLLERLYTPPGPTVDSCIALGAWSQSLILSAEANDRSLFASDWFTRTGTLLAASPPNEKAGIAIRQILALASRAVTPEDLARLKMMAQDLGDML